MLAAERPRGVFSRQLVLGDTLDTDSITASYDTGVLTLRIPVAEKSKPRKITIGTNAADHHIIEHATAEVGNPSPPEASDGHHNRSGSGTVCRDDRGRPGPRRR